MKAVRTVGDLKELLKYSEDEEPLTLILESGSRKFYIECNGASSTAGGRATILWFDYKDKAAQATYSI